MTLNSFERLDQADPGGFGAGVRICAVLLSPVTPGLSAKILAEFGFEGGGESHMLARGWLSLPHHAASTGISC